MRGTEMQYTPLRVEMCIYIFMKGRRRPLFILYKFPEMHKRPDLKDNAELWSLMKLFKMISVTLNLSCLLQANVQTVEQQIIVPEWDDTSLGTCHSISAATGPEFDEGVSSVIQKAEMCWRTSSPTSTDQHSCKVSWWTTPEDRNVSGLSDFS